ncbi:ALP1-like protein [Tanacetum coccineum]
MLEVVALHDLWIWHAFFGVASANNDINVLDNSPLFDDLLDGIALVAPFVVNGVGFENGYYLVDRIYARGQLSSNCSLSQMTRNMATLKGDKKVHEKMSNVLLVFSNELGNMTTTDMSISC